MSDGSRPDKSENRGGVQKWVYIPVFTPPPQISDHPTLSGHNFWLSQKILKKKYAMVFSRTSAVQKRNKKVEKGGENLRKWKSFENRATFFIFKISIKNLHFFENRTSPLSSSVPETPKNDIKNPKKSPPSRDFWKAKMWYGHPPPILVIF